MVDIGTPNGYMRVDGFLRKVIQAGDIQLLLQASNIRVERTGLHAKVEILAQGVPIAYDTFNVERNGDRVTLANAAYKQLEPARNADLASYPSKKLKFDLDMFCAGLQDAHIESRAPGRMAGSLVRREPRFVLKPYMLEAGGTILFAPPGQGKSYILWLMAVCIDAGIDLLWPVTQTNVLVVNLERSQVSVEDRLGNINSVLGLDRERTIHTLNARGETLESLAPVIDRYVRNHGIGCVLLDSMSRAGKGTMLADDVVNRYCDILNGFKVAWLALAHSPRGDATHVFGSVMFEAAADLLVKLDSYTKNNGTMGVALDVTKRNDIGIQPVWIGALAFDRMGLTVTRLARPGEFSALEGVTSIQPDEHVIRYLTRLGADGDTATNVAKQTGIDRSVVSSMFNNDDRFRFLAQRGRDKYFGLAAVRLGGKLTGTDNTSHNTSGPQHIDNTSDQEDLPF